MFVMLGAVVELETLTEVTPVEFKRDRVAVPVPTVEVTVTDSTEDIVGVTIEAFANVAFKESVPAPPAKTSVVFSV